MKKRIVSSIGLVLAAAVVLVSFQNCASDFNIDAYTDQSSKGSSDSGGSDGGGLGGGGGDPGTGTPTPTPTQPPVTVTPTPTPAAPPAEVAAGERYSCAIKSDGTAYCWGVNNGGQLGNGTLNQAVTPVPVSTNLKFKKIATGSLTPDLRATTCAIDVSGGAWCWGNNSSGQLGANLNPSTSPRLTPIQVVNLPQVVDIKVGSTTVCARTAGGLLYCWGSNLSGELGINSTAPNSILPVQVLNVNTVGDFDISQPPSGSSTLNRVCAVLFGGQVYCWGAYHTGLGINTPARVPTLIANFPNVIDIEVQLFSTCGRTAQKQLVCSGYGLYGGRSLLQYLAPGLVAGLNNVEAVSLGHLQGCVVFTGGSVACFGLNSFLGVNNVSQATGHLGQSVVVPQLTTPTLIPGVAGVVNIDVGNDHTCFSLSNNVVQCLGNNDFGGLGNATTVSTHIPQNVGIP